MLTVPASEVNARNEVAACDRRGGVMSLKTDQFRSWLMLLARTRVGGALRGKVDSSDIVQPTLLLATRDAAQFRGTSDAELAGRLRGIMGHLLAHEFQSLATAKRDASLEVSMDSLLEQSARRLDEFLAATQTSTSHAAIIHEEHHLLATVLERLPEDHREVLVLRHLEGLSFPEIAERMSRNTGTVRMLWVRALAQLKVNLGKH